MIDARGSIASWLAMLRANGQSAFSCRVAIAVLCFVAVYLALAGVIGYPIFASDEYAYLIRGKFYEFGQDLRAFDPGLQSLNNRLYFAWLHVLSAVAAEHVTELIRLVHILQYALAALITWATFRRLQPDSHHLLGMVGALLLPNAIYVLSAMPETEMVLLGSGLLSVAALWYERHPLRSAALAGVITAAAVMVKPHGLAFIPAFLGFVLLVPRPMEAKGLRARLLPAVLFLLSAYSVHVVLWRCLSGEFTLDPSMSLGLGFYGNSVGAGASLSELGAKLWRATGYLAGNFEVLLLAFAPAMLAMTVAVCRWLKRPGIPAEAAWLPAPLRPVALFGVLMLGAHVAMTAYFTAGVAERNAFEAWRLHGRYLGPALLLLPFVQVVAIRAASVLQVRFMAGLGATAALAFLLLVAGRYKIYPWDNPLLFAFFQNQNDYQWRFDGALPLLGSRLAWALLGSMLLALWRPRIARPVLVASSLFVLGYGQLLTLDWIRTHTRDNGGVVADSRAAARLVGASQPGRGLLVTANRYGSASYILYALGNAPRVLIRANDEVVTEEDVADANWILFDGPYRPDFWTARSQDIGSLHLLTGSESRLGRSSKQAWLAGSVLQIDLGEAVPVRMELFGFNAAEPWGRWTAQPVAEIELPHLVHGAVAIELEGWIPPERTGQPLHLQLGDAGAALMLTPEARVHRVQLQPSSVVDRLRLSFPTWRPPESTRDLGVAIKWIRLSSTDAIAAEPTLPQ